MTLIPVLWFLWYCRPVRSKKTIATHSLGQGKEE